MTGRLLRILAALLVGLTLSQYPEFVQQYLQRLGGAVDALRPIVERFDASAAEFAMDRQAALSRLRANTDTLVVRQAESASDTIARYEKLVGQQRELASSDPVERLVRFPRLVDIDLAERTLDIFRPAIPVSAEGAILAGLGFLLGYGAVVFLLTLVRGLAGLRRPPVYG